MLIIRHILKYKLITHVGLGNIKYKITKSNITVFLTRILDFDVAINIVGKTIGAFKISTQ